MLDFIKDIFSAFKQNSIERIRNPFIGAFVFSWLGFNWQALAILLLSDKDITKRIIYINETHDVGSFLLGPICTTILICWILPEINKFFTRLQNKPNSETTEIIMQSKIDIAEKQLQIADIEAKKKLAIKREERNIEENINETNRRLEEAENKDKENIKKIKELELKIMNESTIRINTEADLKVMSEVHDKLSKQYKKAIENIEIKNMQIKNQENEINSLEMKVNTYQEDNKQLASDFRTIFSLTTSYRLKITESSIPLLKQVDLTPE